MTVMSEGLLLNSKYIKMGREEGGFQALLTQLPLVIVCHELIIWRLTIYGFAKNKEMIKKRKLIFEYEKTIFCRK